MRKAVFAVALLLLPAVTGAQEEEAEAGGLGVADAVVATSINEEQREPVGVATSFSADVGKLWCFTRITGATEDIEVAHVWYHGDQEMARVQMPVRGASWRTWSSKNIVSDWTGEWRVDVVGPDGTVLHTIGFTVTEGP